MIRPDYILDDEDSKWFEIGEGSGPNKGIFYIESTQIYITGRILLNRFLMGSDDPPANQNPPGIYTDYNNTTFLFAQSVLLHETFGTGDNPPTGLVPNADGHLKGLKPYVDSINIRNMIEPKLGFTTYGEFRSDIYEEIFVIRDTFDGYANSQHEYWTDPYPENALVDFWYIDFGWFQQDPTTNY